ncbi:MAG: SLC45 family MFS transporter [Paludibacteraceae bacterium]|nr:SLC45 family MFS transporter [Paludibacteraceae bacterium]MDY6373177.1 MFS transporter [Bacteroidales bacterium]MDY6426832.1 MFS transporter [Bacteroidales bacterium]
MQKNRTFTQLFNISFGFFGVQIAYALQSANISRIFATLGADPHTLSFFWILPPLMGMLVQPLVGKYSDKTWCRLGRRKPYLIVGAIIAVAVMIMLPNAGNFTFAQGLFLGLNAAMWFGLFSLMFLDTSINIAMQPFKMMVGDMVSTKQKGLAYSIQSFLCNAGSLVGYMFPIFFTWIGIANEAPDGVIPDSVKWSFYIGAAILLLCVLYTFVTVKELNPQEYAEFHGLDKEQGKDASTSNKGFIALLKEAPSTFWTVGLVQFFCWSAFMYMWTYSNGAIASLCFNWDGGSTQVAEFQDAGNWVGVVFAVQAIGSLIWAGLLPVIENAVGNKKAYAISLLVGAVGFISIFYVHDQYLLFLSYALIGATWAAMLAIPFTILTNSLKGDNMGFYLGLFNCTICLPQIIAAVCGGLILSMVGSQAAMLVVAGVLLILGAACVGFIKENNK